jgi:hypothetical protein
MDASTLINWEKKRKSVLHKRTKSLKLLASLCQFQIDREIVLGGGTSAGMCRWGSSGGYFVEPIINKLAFMMAGTEDLKPPESKATLSYYHYSVSEPPLEGSFYAPP